jgi:hypothetical protein
MTWQPIETAPHDGSRILVYADNRMYVVRWTDPDEYDYNKRCLSEYANWHVDDNKHGPFALRGPSPTHWMPLPEPP